MNHDNPLSEIWLNENLLREGLVKTYPITAAKKHITEFMGLPLSAFKIEKGVNGTDYAIIQFPATEHSYDDVVKTMDVYGYTLVNKNSVEKVRAVYGWYFLQFEPKFQNDASELLKNERFLFHITPKVYKDRILKNGFVPYNRNNQYNYQPRVYFMLGSNDPADTVNMISKLSRVKYGNIDRSKYCAFKVDVKKIPQDIKFHLDPYKSGAVWTSSNVPPLCIIDVIDFTGE